MKKPDNFKSPATVATTRENMPCRRFEKEIWDYLDGRADGFSAHLRECPGCRDRLEKAAKLLSLLKASAAPAPPSAYRESFWPRLKEKLTAPGLRPGPFSILKQNPLYYAAMTAAAAALVLWVSIRTPDSSFMTSAAAAPPDYILPPAGRVTKAGEPAVNYISGCRPDSRGPAADNNDYILPGTMSGGGNSWAV